jgi:hypothetical protein
MEKTKIEIPDWLMEIKYNGQIIPNGITYDIATTGANCQVFAYYLLRSNQLIVPEYRSSELWADMKFSKVITDNFELFDILFFHRVDEAYGAHIAIYLGNNQAIHLSKKIGKPVIWNINTFLEDPKYKFLLGGKRFYKNKSI